MTKRTVGQEMTVDEYKAAERKAMSEADFQREVIRIAQENGWKVAHFRTAMTRDGRYLTPVAADGAGWPDLFMVRGERGIAAELKSERGVVTDEQRAWIHALFDVGMTAAIWRPRDLDEIEAVLR